VRANTFTVLATSDRIWIAAGSGSKCSTAMPSPAKRTKATRAFPLHEHGRYGLFFHNFYPATTYDLGVFAKRAIEIQPSAATWISMSSWAI